MTLCNEIKTASS